MDAHYWWPNIYKDTLHVCKSCDECQKIGNLTFYTTTKLMTTLLSNPFMKWGLYFIGQMKPVGRYTWKKSHSSGNGLHHQMGGSKGITLQHDDSYDQILI